MGRHLDLLVPEWQGCGASNESHAGARAAFAAVGSPPGFVDVEIPRDESLVVEGNVLGRRALTRNLDRLRAQLDDALPDSIFTIGGTCAIEVVPVSYLNHRVSGRLAVVWLDAHADLNTPETSPSGHFHGMPLRALLGESSNVILERSYSTIGPEQVFLVGTRDVDPPERSYIEENGVGVFSGTASADRDALVAGLRAGGFDAAYLHVDLDVLDPDAFPHVLVPAENGLSVEELGATIDAVTAAVPIVGSSLLEFVPRDASGTDIVRSIATKLMTATGSGHPHS